MRCAAAIGMRRTRLLLNVWSLGAASRIWALQAVAFSKGAQGTGSQRDDAVAGTGTGLLRAGFGNLRLDFSSRTPRFTGYAVSALGAGAVFHALDLVARGLQAGNIPVANFSQALSFLAWVTALAGLVMIVRLRVAVIGALVAPSVLIALGASEAMQGGAGGLPHALRSVWLPVHVTLAFAGEALLVLAATVSLVYLFQESRLKAHRPLLAGPGGMPSLEKLDRINYRLLGWGFAPHPCDTQWSVVGRTHLGPVLVVGAARDMVVDHLAALCRAAGVASDRGMARAARGDLDYVVFAVLVGPSSG